jgi:hypothetical protein
MNTIAATSMVVLESASIEKHKFYLKNPSTRTARRLQSVHKVEPQLKKNPST